MAKLQGTGTAIVTPFKSNGEVDEKALKELVEWQVKSKVEFLVPCGSTGEAITMTRDEKKRVIEIVLEQVNGRIPVIPGTGVSSTAESVNLTKDAKQEGADTVLVVGPAYNKPTQEGYYQHFKEIIDRCDVKIVMYNVPSRTAGNILPETTLRLAEEYKNNIIAIKEASNNFEQIMQIIKYRPTDFAVLSGDDMIAMPLISSGADGVISVVANEVPGEFSEMIRLALKGDYHKAGEIHYKLYELMKINFIESNPIPAKTALNLMGKIEDNFRLPLVKMSSANKEKLGKVLKELKLV